jgi:NADPH-dependent glutamate synthase beta subunit-like oxidoreductase
MQDLLQLVSKKMDFGTKVNKDTASDKPLMKEKKKQVKGVMKKVVTILADTTASKADQLASVQDLFVTHVRPQESGPLLQFAATDSVERAGDGHDAAGEGTG